jgi:predicted amidohydrolase YtcJ
MDMGVHIHSVGDQSTSDILTAIEATSHLIPDKNTVAIAHLESTNPKDYGRFSKLKARLIISFQWVHPPLSGATLLTTVARHRTHRSGIRSMGTTTHRQPWAGSAWSGQVRFVLGLEAD